jgi:phosphoglycolate phosphatase-like HAD superfamily hydrolase
VIEHIEAKHGHIPLAVVSGSRRSSVMHSLSALGLVEKFEVLVCAEDYARGKPEPDCCHRLTAPVDRARGVPTYRQTCSPGSVPPRDWLL